MSIFSNVKNKAMNDAKSGKGYREKDPSQMTNKELDREITGNKSIVGRKKYAEEKIKRSK